MPSFRFHNSQRLLRTLYSTPLHPSCPSSCRHNSLQASTSGIFLTYFKVSRIVVSGASTTTNSIERTSKLLPLAHRTRWARYRQAGCASSGCRRGCHGGSGGINREYTCLTNILGSIHKDKRPPHERGTSFGTWGCRCIVGTKWRACGKLHKITLSTCWTSTNHSLCKDIALWAWWRPVSIGVRGQCPGKRRRIPLARGTRIIAGIPVVLLLSGPPLAATTTSSCHGALKWTTEFWAVDH